MGGEEQQQQQQQDTPTSVTNLQAPLTFATWNVHELAKYALSFQIPRE